MKTLRRDAFRNATLPPSVFFVPTDDFLVQLMERGAGRRIIDAGAGTGRLSRQLREAGYVQVAAIDIIRRSHSETEVERVDAVSFPYRPGDLVVLARPCHGEWIEKTVRAATDAGAEVICIGRPSRIHDDFSADALEGAKLLDGPLGADDEVAFLFDAPIPDFRLSNGNVRF